MCEYCKKTEVTIETLDTDDQYPCEWITEEAGPGACAELALYSVSEWYVEDHLCDAHKLATEKEMEEGLGDFLDSVEFRSQFERYDRPSLSWATLLERSPRARLLRFDCRSQGLTFTS
jgi:hypothetical protein